MRLTVQINQYQTKSTVCVGGVVLFCCFVLFHFVYFYLIWPVEFHVHENQSTHFSLTSDCGRPGNLWSHLSLSEAYVPLQRCCDLCESQMERYCSGFHQLPLSVLRNIQKFIPGQACPGRWQDKAAGTLRALSALKAQVIQGLGFILNTQVTTEQDSLT